MTSIELVFQLILTFILLLVTLSAPCFVGLVRVGVAFGPGVRGFVLAREPGWPERVVECGVAAEGRAGQGPTLLGLN